MLRTNNQIRVTQQGDKLTARAGNPIRQRAPGVVSPRSATKEQANMYTFGSGGGNNSMSVNVLPQGGLLYDTMLSGLLGENEQTNMRFYRDIYHYDTVAGAAVDLMSTMPFSDFHLEGCEDKSRINTYMASVEALNLKTLFPEVSVDYLVTGSFTATPIYKSSAKKFVDLIPWRTEDCDVRPGPFLGLDPMIRVKPNPEMHEFLTSQESHFEKMRERLNQNMLEALQSESIELDPLTTLYVPRKTFTYNHKGTSFFKRILPLYLIEKSLYRGTLIEAGRRQRAMLHIPMGDDLWDPMPEEMQAIVALFQQADQDPLGAIVGTRSAVTPAEFRQGGDFWKYTDITDVTTSMKLRALGISESFLSGEATYASMEVSLSVFVENLRAYRNMVTQKVFYNKLFPLLAYSNGFMKKNAKAKKSETAAFGEMTLKHNLNDATMLDMPVVHWQKALRPEADQAYLEVLGTLKEHGVPVGIATWAAAGGMTTEQLIKELKADEELKKQIKKITGVTPGENNEDGDAFDDAAAHGQGQYTDGEYSGGEEAARVLGPLLGRRRRSIMSRTFEHEYETVTRTGKRKSVLNQKRERDRQYDMLAKSVKAMAGDGHHGSILSKIRQRLGSVPNIIGA